MGCSIFIASSTTTRSPAATVAPSSTATLTIVPCMGAVRESPEAADPLPPPPRLRGLAAAPGAAPPGARAGGRRPPEPASADLDDDRLPRRLLVLPGRGRVVGGDLVVP